MFPPRSRRYNAQKYSATPHQHQQQYQQYIPPQPEQVELYMSCRDLVNLDTIGKSDAQIRLYVQKNGRWELFGKTETRTNNLNPIFRVTFTLDFVFEIPTYLKFEVVDIDGPDAFEMIGTVETPLSAIMGSRGQSVTLDLNYKNIRNRGKITIKGEQFVENQNMLTMQWAGVKLMNTDGPRDKSDPFLRFFKKRATGEWLQVHQTEVVMNNLDPLWKAFEIGDSKLCKNSSEAIRIECWDYEKSGDYQFIGHCETTLNDLRAGNWMLELQNYKSRTKPGYLRLAQFSLQRLSQQYEPPKSNTGGYNNQRDYDRYNPYPQQTPSYETPRYPTNAGGYYDNPPSKPTRIYPPSNPSPSNQQPPRRQLEEMPDILTRKPASQRQGNQKPTPPPPQQYQEDFSLDRLRIDQSEYIAKPSNPSYPQQDEVPEYSFQDLLNGQNNYTPKPKPSSNYNPPPQQQQQQQPKPQPQRDWRLDDLNVDQSEYIPKPKPSTNQQDDVPEYSFQDLLNGQNNYTPKPKPPSNYNPPPQQQQPKPQPQKEWSLDDVNIDQSQYIPKPKPSQQDEVPEYNFKDLLNNQNDYTPKPTNPHDQYEYTPRPNNNHQNQNQNEYNPRPTNPYDQYDHTPRPNPSSNYNNPPFQQQPIPQQQVPRPTFLDYLRTGTTLNTVVAVDFSSSNGPLSSPQSLHASYEDGSMNEYQKAIYCVCQILLNYDYDQQSAMLGFGAIPNYPNLKSKTVSDCFPMTGSFEQQQALGLQGVMDIYSHALKNVELSGPTHFAPIIRETMNVCEQNKLSNNDVYTILLIVTSGKVNDFEETKDLIVKAAALPLSIIIVGVGNGDFTNMEILDGDFGLVNSKGEKAKRDLVQFVPFKEYNDMTSLAQGVLQEVPDQLVEYMAMVGKMPRGYGMGMM